MALIFGAPDTVPAGKMERKASNLERKKRRLGIHLERGGENELPRLAFSKSSRDLRSQMDNMTKLLQLHKVVHLDSLRLANTINVVSCQIDQHDVLCAVLFGSQKNSTELLVL